VTVAVIVGAVALVLLLAFLSDRRDRRNGHQPGVADEVGELRRDARALRRDLVRAAYGTRWMHHLRRDDEEKRPGS
jgi:hypothetical protein